MTDKNVAQGSSEEISLQDGIHILKLQNDSLEIQRFTRDIDLSYIQFHFCLKGRGKFIFNEGRYALEVSDENSLLLYNPKLDLPMNLELQPQSWLVSVVMTIRKFHSLFSTEADYIHFLSGENKDTKYYTQEAVTPAMAVILSQIMNFNLHPSIKELYMRAKVYELMALYFNQGGDADMENCPFLVDEDNLKRIRQAKEIIIAQMAEPPTLKELSDQIGLPLKKLKEGFKQVYGEPVFSFLFEYKMDYARKMLESGKYNVNEVGHQVGYSTSSHFIAAFKKKYGTTPKKYLMSMASS